MYPHCRYISQSLYLEHFESWENFLYLSLLGRSKILTGYFLYILPEIIGILFEHHTFGTKFNLLSNQKL